MAAGTGVITVIPLLFFAAGTRRLPLSILGLLQYLALADCAEAASV
jgi:chloramphenicol-sensitive protein RarD